MIATLLASNAFRYALALSIAFGMGWSTHWYSAFKSNQVKAAQLEASYKTNKQIFHAGDAAIKAAGTVRESVRVEYRDRLRDISSSETKQCPAATPDRAPGERNNREDGSTKEASARTTKDDLADIAAECYAGVLTIREQLRALIQAEESIKD